VKRKGGREKKRFHPRKPSKGGPEEKHCTGVSPRKKGTEGNSSDQLPWRSGARITNVSSENAQLIAFYFLEREKTAKKE